MNKIDNKKMVILKLKITTLEYNVNKLSEKSKLFYDPLDVHIRCDITFSDSSIVNDFRRILMSKIRVKVLKITRITYKAMPMSTLESRKDGETYGRNMDIEEQIKQLPIHQDLPIGTIFKLEEEHIQSNIVDSGIYCKSVLTEKLETNTIFKGLKFNRRSLLLTLLPDEQISLTAEVVELPEDNIDSIMPIIWIGRPFNESLFIITCLNQDTIIVIKKTIEYMKTMEKYKNIEIKIN
jgi:hypothetical protein